MGTVFHSANGGGLWDSYAFGNLQGGRLARMQFTSDPAVVYVLDGRVDYATYLGGAIFKSVNGGPVVVAIVERSVHQQRRNAEEVAG